MKIHRLEEERQHVSPTPFLQSEGHLPIGASAIASAGANASASRGASASASAGASARESVKSPQERGEEDQEGTKEGLQMVCS